MHKIHQINELVFGSFYAYVLLRPFFRVAAVNQLKGTRMNKRSFSSLSSSVLAVAACLGTSLAIGVTFTSQNNRNISSIIKTVGMDNLQLLTGCGFYIIGGTTEDTVATNLTTCDSVTSAPRTYPNSAVVAGQTSGYYMSPVPTTTPWLPDALTFTLDSNPERMLFSATLGPSPQDIDTVSLPLDASKSLMTHFRYSGSSTLYSYATAPTFAYYQNSNPSLPISIYHAGTSNGWGETINQDHTIRYTITSASRDMRLFFVNAPETNNVEFSIDPAIANDTHFKTGETVTIAGSIEVSDTDPGLFASSYLLFDTESSAYHQSGRYDGDGWSVNVVDDSPGNFMNYGPYSTSVSAEAHTAVFRLQVDNVDADNYNILYIDVYDATTDTVVASKSIYRNEFRVPSKYQNFKLAFTPSAPYHSFEFRTYWFGGSYVKQDKVAVF